LGKHGSINLDYSLPSIECTYQCEFVGGGSENEKY